MEKRVLFVSEVLDSFLITALIKAIEGAGYEVLTTQPHPKEIEDIEDLPNIFLVYLDNDATRYNTTLEFFADKLAADNNNSLYLYLVGNPAEIEAAYRYVPHALVAGSFKRPVNTTDLITQMDLVCTGYSLDADSPENVKTDDAAKLDSGKKSLLLVDDDSAMLRSMQGLLAKNYNIYITNSGMNTITFLKDHSVDLILLDYEMPVLSGLEVFQILRTEPATANIPVIFLTSKDDKDIVMKVLSVKPVNYLLKPISPGILIQTVDNFFKEQEYKEKHKDLKKKKEVLELLEPVD